ncbi:hypothetical protein [Alkalibacillus salilacus]|uniref:Uncharacterized protein n=1 Tax=Alkalibacillus salilacus TaxID=284582 RepID=A0ABT9VDB4_9BACI|nr:hypothetical protein [Alkalibacillus salilacus]MDQ0158965.1 hypothetical protein [Alkalibacillus salilacus]
MKVLKRFKDKHTGERFGPGDTVDWNDKDRVQSAVNRGLLEDDTGFLEAKSKQPPNEPKHVGGGYYELPNGDRVRGKEKAEKALKEMRGD